MPISTYIINLKSRTERKKNVLKEFNGRDEFNLTFVEPIKHNVGAVSLWETIKYILTDLIDGRDDFILLCEDDHIFTDSYSSNDLFECIKEAIRIDADILLGGMSWFQTCIRVSEKLFWIEKFSALQFTIIFKRFYKKILQSNFSDKDVPDYKISELTDNKFVIYPFISTQKEFGYSDVTPKNNGTDRVEELFRKSAELLGCLDKISTSYRRHGSASDFSKIDIESVTIPTFIINLAERKDRLKHIRTQFAGKKEFDITIIEACKHKIGSVGLWYSIKKVIESAIANNEDVIVICEDDHQFTEDYNKKGFITSILKSHQAGCEILNGGIGGGFDHAIFVDSSRVWVNSFCFTQFIVLFKSIFTKILNEPFSELNTVDQILSELTSHKMILYPFISVQKDFGYSDVKGYNDEKDLINTLPEKAIVRLHRIREATETWDNPASIRNVMKSL